MTAAAHRVVHFDTLRVRFDRSTLQVQADMSRMVDGIGAHVGTYTYHDDQGRPFIEHVPASTLFEPASLDSAAGGALTIRHGPGLVTPDRYREESHGAWVKAWDAGDGNLGVRLRLGSEDAISFVDQAIAKGEPVELSPVYEVDVVAGQDDAEARIHGRHDAVQHQRRYSGIALLGPNEARGGSAMTLKLDAATSAPAGTRIQVGGARLDSAPSAPLHSETGRSNTMKHALIRSDGFRPRKITVAQLAALRSVSHKDAIEKGTVTVAIEGEEPDEFVLPKSMIEMLLEGIGASSEAAPEAPPVEETVEMEAMDADEDEAKADARMVIIARREIAKSDARRTKGDARDASVKSDAATILPSAYDYSVNWAQVCVDAIAKVAPDLEQQARKLAKDSATDPESAGMLRQMLAERRQDSPDTPTNIVTKGDSNNAQPWDAATPPETKQ